MSSLYVNAILAILSNADDLSLLGLKKRLYGTLEQAAEAMDFGPARAHVREVAEQIDNWQASRPAILAALTALLGDFGYPVS